VTTVLITGCSSGFGAMTALALARRGDRVLATVRTPVAGRLIGIPFEGAYVASKHAVEGLSETMRLELAASGITVMLIEPGAFTTGLDTNIAYSAGFGADDPQRPDHDRFFDWRASSFDTGTPPDPQLVVDAIINAVDHPHGPFRRLVGADAELVGALTRDSTFEDYEQIIQTALR
jgi:NAD(P)-dependent dehydrogenase (short-subunit alcohol dehydrogenase family)